MDKLQIIFNVLVITLQTVLIYSLWKQRNIDCEQIAKELVKIFKPEQPRKPLMKFGVADVKVVQNEE